MESFNSNLKMVSNSNHHIDKSELNVKNLSQFFRQYQGIAPHYAELPVNNSSVMLNFRKNFVNEFQLDSSSCGRNLSQKRISQYFPEIKSIGCQTATPKESNTKKRSLQELQMKYNSVPNLVANLSNIEETYPEPAPQNHSTAIIIKKRKFNTPSDENRVKVLPPIKEVEYEEVKKDKPAFIHLIGLVDNILRWHHILQDTKISILYNVLGYFISATKGVHAKEKFVFIRSNTGIVLECSYFETDHPLPIILKDQFVECFGYLIGVQRFKLFSINVKHDVDFNKIRRALFLSQRITHDLSNRESS